MRTIVDDSQKVPIHSWAEHVDRQSLERLKTLARWDRLAGPIAVMPDVHFANEVCVGAVLVTEDCLLPTAIGEDLGCGMCSQCYAIDARTLEREDLKNLLAQLMRVIPSGRRAHKQSQPVPGAFLRQELSTGSLRHQKDWLGSRHLGTLGQGNHFVELQRDTLGRLWATVHSGSRGIGAAIAGHHSKIAADQVVRGQKPAPLPYLEIGTAEAMAFLSDLSWAVEYAVQNRKQMLERITEVLLAHTNQGCACSEYFDVTHNLITAETHLGKRLFVHRKGAMPAEAGRRGVIPGSMGTASYLVDGLGNSASYASCSHGAGRALSRGEAHRQIQVKDFRRQMSHVVHPEGAWIEKALIEEAPRAYKDIKMVLAEQRDLVKPVLRLEPLMVLKGGS